MTDATPSSIRRYPGGQCIELLSDQLGGWNGAQGDGELYIDLDVPVPTLFVPEYTFDYGGRAATSCSSRWRMSMEMPVTA